MTPFKTLKQLYDKDAHVIFQEKGSPPRVLFSGEDLLLEDLPVGTRVIFPRPPLEGVPNLKAAIRWAINNPMEMEPLHALLRPGMKVTIAIDDISMPLPPMVTPDVRQSILEVVLELLSDSGVDDIHLVIANALHRRMTDAEMKRMVGKKIFNAFFPERYYNHDAEDKNGMLEIGRTELDEPVIINRRAAESDLLIYVNLNFVPMNGGHKSVATGLAGYQSISHHHNPETLRATESYMEPSRSALYSTMTRMGKLIDEKLKVFHIESAINNRMYGNQLGFLMKKEEHWEEFDRLKFKAMQTLLKRSPRPLKRKILHSIPAPYDIIGVFAGKTEPTHERILELCHRQYAVPVKGQSDIVIMGIPHISPYSVNSILNPILVQVMAQGYLFNLNRGTPLLKKGGILIITHPLCDEFDPIHHPSYIEFFHRLLPETRDAHVLSHKYEREFAENPSYIHLYRKGNAYHGVHPFYMWYWGERGRAHMSRVICVGTENNHVPKILGWDRADTLAEAIEEALGTLGRSASISLVHLPPTLQLDVKL